MSLTESNATIQDLQERITQLQRALTSSEHDRRVIQERLDTSRSVPMKHDMIPSGATVAL